MSPTFDYNELMAARARLRDVFREASVMRHSRYFLRSGDEVAFYFDFDIVTNDPNKCIDIVTIFSGEIEQISLYNQIDYLAFIEKRSGATVGAIRLSAAISTKVGLPSLIVRLGKELIIERVKIPIVSRVPAWQKLANTKIVLVTDHITRGREVIHAIDTVGKLGAKVTDVITYTLKPESAKDKISELVARNINLHSMFDLYDLNKEKEHYDISPGGVIYARENFIASTGFLVPHGS